VDQCLFVNPETVLPFEDVLELAAGKKGGGTLLSFSSSHASSLLGCHLSTLPQMQVQSSHSGEKRLLSGGLTSNQSFSLPKSRFTACAWSE
jgi:hypothetical protein